MSNKAKWNPSERHPVNFLAVLLGFDRATLARKIAIQFGTAQKKFTVAEAADAWTARSEVDEARRRKNIAEAENAELDARKKKGELMPRSQFRHVVGDLGTQTRTTIEAARFIPKKDRLRLLKLINAIKPIEPK